VSIKNERERRLSIVHQKVEAFILRVDELNRRQTGAVRLIRRKDDLEKKKLQKRKKKPSSWNKKKTGHNHDLIELFDSPNRGKEKKTRPGKDQRGGKENRRELSGKKSRVPFQLGKKMTKKGGGTDPERKKGALSVYWGIHEEALREMGSTAKKSGSIMRNPWRVQSRGLSIIPQGRNKAKILT